MPAPIGGAIAIMRSVGRSSYEYQSDVFDQERHDYRVKLQFIKENLKCTMNFFKSIIPPTKGKLEGAVVLEAKEDIKHSGMFILMKGLPIVPKKRQVRKPLSNVKFTVLGSTYTGEEGEGGECMLIEGGSQETYPLEVELPEDLPPPMITSDGKLVYRMQLFISTGAGRHIPVSEVPIRWQGCRVVSREEVEKSPSIEQQVVKRGLLGLGRRKSCELEWVVEKGGYLPGDGIQVELLGQTSDKVGVEVECKLELLQKVWYQVPSATQSGKMWVKMKVTILTAAPSNVFSVEGGEEKKVIWQEKLKVPKGLTPTFKYDFMNSVSYTIRTSAGMAGESRENWVTAEVPILIGSSREPGLADEKRAEAGEDNQDDDDEEEEGARGSRASLQTPGSGASNSPEHPFGTRGRRNSGDSTGPRRSMSMSFFPSWARPRAASVSSVDSCQSLASSTLSVFRLPPSYSQLSSRRPTLETLPPPYYELELQEQGGSQDSTREFEQSLPSSASVDNLAVIEEKGQD